jgi:hypothetical protein
LQCHFGFDSGASISYQLAGIGISFSTLPFRILW